MATKSQEWGLLLAISVVFAGFVFCESIFVVRFRARISRKYFDNNVMLVLKVLAKESWVHFLGASSLPSM